MEEMIKQKLKEPYASLVDILPINDILAISRELKGRQITFKKIPEDTLSKYPEFEVLIGHKNALAVARIFNNEIIYFHEIKEIDDKEKHRRVREEFNGGNHAYLAKKYGYSERSIYRILSKANMQKNVVDERQICLWD